MKTSESLKNIAPALVQALGELRGATKDSKNPHFKNDYASLESVIEHSRPILAAHDLAIIQGPGELVDGSLTITTRVLHKSGEWVESEIHVPLGKRDAQGVGSCTSYGRRYSLMAMLNLPAVDDDGEAASQPDQRKDYGPSPEGKDFWGCEGSGPSAYQAKKDGLDELHDKLRQEIAAVAHTRDLRDWIEERKADIAKMPRGWRVQLRNEVEERGSELGANANDRQAA